MDCSTNNVKFDTDKTSVTLLQDILNKQGVRTVQYELLQIEGAVSAPSFQYRVTDGRFVAYGQGKSKKEAKQHAAKALLRIIHKEFPELCSDPLFESQIDFTSDLNDTFETMNFGDNDERNPIGMLQELCTSLHLPPPVYITECEDGLPHQRLFTVSCNVSEYKETGIGKSKKIAKRLAANNLYLMLKSIQADLSVNSKAAENVDDFVRQQSSNLSGLKNSKSTSQFYRLPEIHRHLPLTEDNFTAEQGLNVSFIDFEELSSTGKYQTSLQVSTPITVAFHGESTISFEEAQQDAAYRSVTKFRTWLPGKNYFLVLVSFAIYYTFLCIMLSVNKMISTIITIIINNIVIYNYSGQLQWKVRLIRQFVLL
ncbi:interferon-inducible double-stranded RNA-dependent protein kinase activator A homolog isoform X3 [Rhopalosiphum padi]|uniref:interferon-inducible double-stranded RNA-dependent protein kinase activator A homolog isoform X3 n=1 Tax=Rhopalosiphum padi TaxID=40932 RepID=UPI00298D9C08|nr:interferon-inducible double-stranded RNA-dependent protein kinase activator A homolog isoform X3 [Rhopalosiphum padi]